MHFNALTCTLTHSTARRLLAVFATALCATLTSAQIPPASSAAGTAAAAKGDSTTVLSPFEVRSEQDVGYQAANTTSGSRLNSALKDTAASISVFTPEFIADIAANNLSEMLAYATNVEAEFEDSNAGFNSPTTRKSDGTTGDFRIRGIAAGYAIDLVETAAPQDNYNIERVEVSSGPNSVLFGLSSAGGLVTLATKRANLLRDRSIAKAQFGSWSQQRYELDLNRVLIPQKLGLRLMGLSGDREGWRHWDFEDTRRWTGAVTYRPFKDSMVRGSFERGTLKRHAAWPWNAGDQITLWRAQGAVVKDGFVTATDTPRGLATFGANNRFAFYENDGTFFNLRNELQSIGFAAGPGPTLLQPEDMPYDYTFNGPGSHFLQHYANHQITVEQRVSKDLSIEFAYLHNDSDAFATGWNTQSNDIALRADPNLTLPDPRSATGDTVPNPRAGQYYMEGAWKPESTQFKNDVLRLTAAYELNLGKWGFHRLAGLGETGKVNRTKHDGSEILVDENNVPLANATPENGANNLWRRHYVTLGDYTTYYQGNPALPFAPRPVAVTTGTTTTVKNANVRTVTGSAGGTGNSIKLTDTLMFAMQNSWWNKKLVTTFGYRVDDIIFKDGLTQRLTPTDPRVLTRERVSGEWEVVAGQYNRYRYQPTTRTTGAVFHLNDRFSVFYNQSTNVGAPRFDRTILPNLLPPPTDGKGRDYGVMIDLTKDGRFFMRANYYETEFLRDTPVIPGSPNYFVSSTTAVLDHLQTQGRITQSERDARAVSFTAFMIDVASRGAELEFVANPVRQWTTRLTYSYSDRGRENYFNEREPYLTDFTNFVRSKDNGAVIAATARTITQELAFLEDAIQDNADSQEQSYGTRPHKFNITSRYSLTEGRLKGGFFGGAYRFSAKSYMQVDLRATSANFGKKYYGDPLKAADFFAGYAARLPWLKSKLTFQLNVKNAFNESLVGRGRFNSNFTGLRRVYLQEPRSWRLTTTLEF